MKSQKRPFQKGIINHCYQRSKDGGLLFYSYSDYLVWFTIVCTVARRYNVTILALCPMPDHVHKSVVASSVKELSDFMRDCSSLYALRFNHECKTEGPVFEARFGSAPKYGSKNGRTNLMYVWNNPVERQLTDKAEDYRWNFLAYAASNHPFSKKLIIRKAGKAMRKAVAEVKAQFKMGLPMTHTQLKRLFNTLTNEECQQLTDHIITTYNVIDYDTALSFFNSYDDLLKAVHSTTSKDHDINEVFIGKTDAHYLKMTSVIMRELKLNDIHDILAMSPDEKFDAFQILRKHSDAMGEQIAKFLHMKFVKL
jgi:REP element-mobilizing transposase RayT